MFDKVEVGEIDGGLWESCMGISHGGMNCKCRPTTLMVVEPLLEISNATMGKACVVFVLTPRHNTSYEG